MYFKNSLNFALSLKRKKEGIPFKIMTVYKDYDIYTYMGCSDTN